MYNVNMAFTLYLIHMGMFSVTCIKWPRSLTCLVIDPHLFIFAYRLISSCMTVVAIMHGYKKYGYKKYVMETILTALFVMVEMILHCILECTLLMYMYMQNWNFVYKDEHETVVTVYEIRSIFFYPTLKNWLLVTLITFSFLKIS